MSTLTREALKLRLKQGTKNGLVVTPLLREKQVGVASVDVRLGNQFIVFRQHAFGAFSRTLGPNPRRVQERLVLRFGSTFVLHPGMLALGATFEYVKMPDDLECQVEGRSSWARVGLEVATATTVEPGFAGVITLELSNVGSVPLELWPGVRIAQLVFHAANPPAEYGGAERKYRCAIGPEFSRIHADPDGRVFLDSPQHGRTTAVEGSPQSDEELS